MAQYNWKSLDALMQPRSVAVIGASPDTGKYPGKVIQNLSRSGYQGRVFPINPKYEEILGYKAYPRVSDLPEPADVALLLIGARNIPAALDELAACGTRTVIVYASGMAEASDEGAVLQDVITQKVRAGGMRMLGPNCLGCIDRVYGTWLSGAAVLGRERLLAGPLAMVTQSGGIMGSFLDRSMAHGIGFTRSIATGNEADINVADCVGYFAQDEDSKAIAVFAESVRDIPKFREACRLAAEREKPVVLLKTGRSDRAKRVTHGHTAAVQGDDDAYDALFRELGVIRVHNLDDLFLIPNLIVHTPRPRGRRIAVISASGGLAGLAADDCDRLGLTMAEFSDETDSRVRELQAGYGGCFNPLDITGQVVSKETWWQVRHMHELLLNDPNVDVVISGQPAGQYADRIGIDLVEMSQAAEKPLVPFWPGREVNADGLARLRDASLPVFEQPDAGFRAAGALVSYAAFLRNLNAEVPAEAGGVQLDGDALRSSSGHLLAGSALLDALMLPKPTAAAPRLADLTVQGTFRVEIHLKNDPEVGPFLGFMLDRQAPIFDVVPRTHAAAKRLVSEWLWGRPASGLRPVVDAMVSSVIGLAHLARASALDASLHYVFDAQGALLAEGHHFSAQTI